MTENTLDAPDEAGHFRSDDNVVVQNSLTGEIVHTPPSYTEIPEFIGSLNDFLNKDEEAAFIHPIIKALTAHFMIAYMHPFVDGNGRTARAVFYWYMLKKGYWLTEYLSISRIIYRTKNSYENSFQFAENDRMDIGYFLSYNLKVLELAFKELKDYIQRKISQKQKAVDFLKLGFVNERQASVLAMVRDDPRIILSVSDICAMFQVSQPTAKADIDKLVERGLLERVQVNGRQFNYVKGEKYDETYKMN
jgi:Fic family protein